MGVKMGETLQEIELGDVFQRARESVIENAKKEGLSVKDYLEKMESEDEKRELEGRKTERQRIERMQEKQIVGLQTMMRQYGLVSLKNLPVEKRETNDGYRRVLESFIMAKRLNCKAIELNDLLVYLLEEFTSAEIVFGLKEATTKMEGFFDMPAFRRFLLKEIRPKYRFMYEQLPSNARVIHEPIYRLKEEFKDNFTRQITNQGVRNER